MLYLRWHWGQISSSRVRPAFYKLHRKKMKSIILASAWWNDVAGHPTKQHIMIVSGMKKYSAKYAYLIKHVISQGCTYLRQFGEGLLIYLRQTRYTFARFMKYTESLSRFSLYRLWLIYLTWPMYISGAWPQPKFNGRDRESETPKYSMYIPYFLRKCITKYNNIVC